MTFLSDSARILVIIGPSGSGKSTVIRELCSRGLLEVTPSWTTRPPRTGEAQTSLEHVFVGSDEFATKEREGFFLKAVELFGLPFRYGLPRIPHPSDGRVPTIMLRAPVVPLLTEFYPSFLVYQIEDRRERVEQRLVERHASGEPLGSRLADYDQEIAAGRAMAHRVFENSGDLADTVQAVDQALREDFGVT